MKKFSIGLLAAILVLVCIHLFISKSVPQYDTHPRHSFWIIDQAQGGITDSTCFSYDRTRLLAKTATPGKAEPNKFTLVWDIVNEKQICKIKSPPFGRRIGFTPNARHFALEHLSEKAAHVAVYETSTGEQVAQILLKDTSGGARDISFMPDGATILVLEESSPSVLKVWKWKEEKEIFSFPCRGSEMEVSNDGRFVVVGGAISEQSAGSQSPYGHDKKARIYDIQTGKLLHELPGHKQGATRFAFSPDDAYVATGGKTPIVRIWNTKTGVLVKSLDMYPGEDRGISSISFSNDGTRLAVSYMFRRTQEPSGFIGKLISKFKALFKFGGQAKDMTSPTVLWDCGTWQPIHVYGLNQAVASPAFLPDDQELVTVDLYGNVRWWNLP